LSLDYQMDRSIKISLQGAREKLKLSVDDVAKQINIEVVELKYYEDNTEDTPCSIIVKLCRIYNIISAEQIMQNNHTGKKRYLDSCPRIAHNNNFFDT